MSLPKQILQHKNESDSYAILQYKLKDLGIFRNVTNSDYGVDFEIEFVENGRVTGNYIKAQVKSSDSIKIKKNGSPAVSGIKQSTLYYWSELSYKTHVIIYLVDLKEEVVYLSRPVFWQAIQLLDNGESSKTITLLPEKVKGCSVEVNAVTKFFSSSPSVAEEIHAHKKALKNIKNFLAMYDDAFHYDLSCELIEPDVFEDFLDVSSVLLFFSKERLEVEGYSRDVFCYSDWIGFSEDHGFDGLAYFVAQKVFKVIFPVLFERLKDMRRRVLSSRAYWSVKNKTYIDFVERASIPDYINHNKFLKICYSHE